VREAATICPALANTLSGAKSTQGLAYNTTQRWLKVEAAIATADCGYNSDKNFSPASRLLVRENGNLKSGGTFKVDFMKCRLSSRVNWPFSRCFSPSDIGELTFNLLTLKVVSESRVMWSSWASLFST